MKSTPWYVRRNRREPLKYTALTDRLYRYVTQCRSGADDAVLEELCAETRRRGLDAKRVRQRCGALGRRLAAMPGGLLICHDQRALGTAGAGEALRLLAGAVKAVVALDPPAPDCKTARGRPTAFNQPSASEQ